MRNFDAFAGAAAYVMLSVILSLQALGPVETASVASGAAVQEVAGCADQSVAPGLLSESVTL